MPYVLISLNMKNDIIIFFYELFFNAPLIKW